MNAKQFCREETRTHPKSVLLWFVGHSDRWGGTHFIITDWNQSTKDTKFSVAPMGLPRHQHIPTALPDLMRSSSPLKEAAPFCSRRHKSTIREFPVHISRESTDQHHVDVDPASQMRNIWVPGVLEWVPTTLEPSPSFHKSTELSGVKIQLTPAKLDPKKQ